MALVQEYDIEYSSRNTINHQESVFVEIYVSQIIGVLFPWALSKLKVDGVAGLACVAATIV